MKRLESCRVGCSAEIFSILELAVEAALAAGKVLVELYDQPHQIIHKGDIDLVTEADVAAEKAILAVLDKDVSGAGILAEESHAGLDAVRGGRTWIIDPLDGTTNYAHAFPWFAVSIGYVDDDGGLAGVIYAPLQDELFIAGRGGGAWLNGRPIKVSATAPLGRSLLATGFPYDVREYPQPVLGAMESVITQCQGIRRAGAAALDLAYLACGRLDGFWEIKLKPWDTAAGQLLVEEAGGRVTDFSGKSYAPFIAEIVATNGVIHDDLVYLLSPFSKI